MQQTNQTIPKVGSWYKKKKTTTKQIGEWELYREHSAWNLVDWRRNPLSIDLNIMISNASIPKCFRWRFNYYKISHQGLSHHALYIFIWIIQEVLCMHLMKSQKYFLIGNFRIMKRSKKNTKNNWTKVRNKDEGKIKSSAHITPNKTTRYLYRVTLPVVK